MAERNLAHKSLNNIINAIPHLMQFPTSRFWIDYDEEADVLYVSLERPQDATDSKMMGNGVIVRYRNKRIIGITILDASKRRKLHS